MDRFLGGSGWRNRDSAENPLVNAYRVAVEGDRASEWVRENERVSDKERASKRTSEWVRERERASERERDWRGRRVAEVVGGCSSRGGNSGGRKERLLASGRPRAAIINSGGMHYRDAGSVGEQPLGTSLSRPLATPNFSFDVVCKQVFSWSSRRSIRKIPFLHYTYFLISK